MIETSLNVFDVIVFTVVGLSALFSFYRGFVREFLSLFTWIGALVITLYAFKPVNEMLKEHIDNELAANLIASLGTYLSALIVLSILTSMIGKYIKPGKEVGVFDNVLGLAFGLLRGIFIVALGFLGLTFVFDEKGYPEYVKTSVTRPYVEDAAAMLAKIAPEYLEDMKPLKEMQERAEDNSVESPADEPGKYQWESMDKLQQMIDEKAKGAE